MSSTSQPVQPWYRIRFVWLVVALPLSAVLASTATVVIAISNPDPVIQVRASAPTERPAVEGRNHAATGGNKPAP